MDRSLPGPGDWRPYYEALDVLARGPENPIKLHDALTGMVCLFEQSTGIVEAGRTGHTVHPPFDELTIGVSRDTERVGRDQVASVRHEELIRRTVGGSGRIDHCQLRVRTEGRGWFEFSLEAFGFEGDYVGCFDPHDAPKAWSHVTRAEARRTALLPHHPSVPIGPAPAAPWLAKVRLGPFVGRSRDLNKLGEMDDLAREFFVALWKEKRRAARLRPDQAAVSATTVATILAEHARRGEAGAPEQSAGARVAGHLPATPQPPPQPLEPPPAAYGPPPLKRLPVIPPGTRKIPRSLQAQIDAATGSRTGPAAPTAYHHPSGKRRYRAIPIEDKRRVALRAMAEGTSATARAEDIAVATVSRWKNQLQRDPDTRFPWKSEPVRPRRTWRLPSPSPAARAGEGSAGPPPVSPPSAGVSAAELSTQRARGRRAARQDQKKEKQHE